MSNKPAKKFDNAKPFLLKEEDRGRNLLINKALTAKECKYLFQKNIVPGNCIVTVLDGATEVRLAKPKKVVRPDIVANVQKIVINTCFGGFGLSDEAKLLYAQKKGIKLVDINDNEYKWGALYYIDGIKDNEHFFDEDDIARDDKDLVAVVLELGIASYGSHAELTVVEVTEGVEWEIDEYDGNETVEECHRRWS